MVRNFIKKKIIESRSSLFKYQSQACLNRTENQQKDMKDNMQTFKTDG